MSRLHGYRHSLSQQPEAAQSARSDADWDKGALLIVALVSVPTIVAAAVAVLLAM